MEMQQKETVPASGVATVKGKDSAKAHALGWHHVCVLLPL
jgi:hypothetical protein